jgi:DNA-binding NarL/FixJ family response regulator
MRILIADDSAVVRDSIKMVIERHSGWFVCGTASNGAEAIRMADELRPDFVVLDLAMPIMDGFHAAARIHAHHPEMPIVMVTQFTSTSLRNEAQKHGISETINKGEVYEYLVRSMAEIAAKSNKDGQTHETTGDVPSESSSDGSPVVAAARAARQR